MSHPMLPEYPYASGDLLARPNTYFYTPYHGAGFLAAWRKQRRTAALSAPSSGTAPCQPIGNTDLLLFRLQETLVTSPNDPEAHRLLQQLVQRFEVTKRIHGEYSDTWRPVAPEDYLSLGRYLSFAQALAIAYSQKCFLPYLNCLLKCLDILTAKRGDLDAGQKTDLNSLILVEERLVRELAEKLHLEHLLDGNAAD